MQLHEHRKSTGKTVTSNLKRGKLAVSIDWRGPLRARKTRPLGPAGQDLSSHKAAFATALLCGTAVSVFAACPQTPCSIPKEGAQVVQRFVRDRRPELPSVYSRRGGSSIQSSCGSLYTRRHYCWARPFPRPHCARGRSCADPLPDRYLLRQSVTGSLLQYSACARSVWATPDLDRLELCLCIILSGAQHRLGYTVQSLRH